MPSGKSYQRQAEEKKKKAAEPRKVGDDDYDRKPQKPQRERGPFAWKAKKKKYQEDLRKWNVRQVHKDEKVSKGTPSQSGKGKPPKTAEEKRHKWIKETTKDEAYSDPTPGRGRHPPSASGKPVQRETQSKVSKPVVKDSKGQAVTHGNGKKVTWSGGLTQAQQTARRENRRRGGRAGYAGGGIALRGFGSTRKI